MSKNLINKMLLVFMLAAPVASHALKVTNVKHDRKGSVTIPLTWISIPVNEGYTIRVSESTAMSGGTCTYTKTEENINSQESRPSTRTTSVDKKICYSKYKIADGACNILGAYDDITEVVPLPRCYGHASGMTNNGWELSRSELNGTWKIQMNRDVKILEKGSLSERLSQIDHDLKRENDRREISCQIEVRTSSNDERNLLSRQLIVERVFLRREAKSVDFRFEISEQNPASDRPEATRAITCSVPQDFVFSNKQILDIKKRDIDTERALKDAIKAVGFELTTPEEKTL